MIEPGDEFPWKAHVRALIYPIQFAKDPASEAERALHVLMKDSERPWSAAGLEKAVDLALASDERLSQLIPQEHPEEAIRRYLSAVRDILKKR